MMLFRLEKKPFIKERGHFLCQSDPQPRTRMGRDAACAELTEIDNS